MTELKPCPFCGCTDLHFDVHIGNPDYDTIICYGCLATFTQQELTCKEDLINAWNRRAEETE